MRAINEHTILGFLKKDPEIYTSEQGKIRCGLIVGTEKQWRDQTGAMKRHVTWHRVIVMGQDAEACKANLRKHHWVFIRGESGSRKTEKDGWITEIHAGVVRFIGGSKEEAAQAYAEGQIPFG